MKVKLLRATMIAGTPTSAGTIVDVTEQAGQVQGQEAQVEQQKMERQLQLQVLTKQWIACFTKNRIQEALNKQLGK